MVIMLKATSTKYRVYLYFPVQDILLRLDKDILFEADMKMDSADKIKEALLGYFVFFLLLRYTINGFCLDALTEVSKDYQCGWKAELKKIDMPYVPYFKIRRYAQKRKDTVDEANDGTQIQYKVKRFPPLNFCC